MRRHLLAAIIGGAVAAAVALPALAGQAPPVGAHRHYIVGEGGHKVYVGPNFCAMDTTSEGFYEFHYRVHQGLDAQGVTVAGEGCPSS